MAILSIDDYISSAKQSVRINKTTTRTSVATFPFTVLDLAGNPGAGTLAGTSTASGVVPDNSGTAGFPVINTPAGGANLYITKVDFASSVACRIAIYDLLWKGGAYAFNASQALASQPSYSTRLPNTDYKGLELWIEAVTAFTGNLTATIKYTNETGTGSRTSTLATGTALTVGRMMQCPLQAGDAGIQKVDNVAGTVATVGTFNVLVMRKLWTGRVPIATSGDTHELIKIGMPQIYRASCLYPVIYADSTSTGIPEIELQLSSL